MEKERFECTADTGGQEPKRAHNNGDPREFSQEDIENKESEEPLKSLKNKRPKEIVNIYVSQSFPAEEDTESESHKEISESQETVASYVPSVQGDDPEITQRKVQVINGIPGSHCNKDNLPDYMKLVRAEERKERESLLIWRKPLLTTKYFFLECKDQLVAIPSVIVRHQVYAELCVFLASAVALICFIPGPHQHLMTKLQKRVYWCLYWFGLGVLSSIGLGTGLHTFLLYLGPHIASVTLAAYECGGLNFPEPPYPDEIKCPMVVDPVWAASLWTIMCKVWVEAVMWGAGTAAGELPPYFMARTARLSGCDPEDEDELREFQEFQRKKEEHPELLTYVDRMKIMVENLVGRMGFFGILACASIPNPLFDLAGITCGHFLVPFWTFFGATLIGKAVIKMMIQQIFVIVAFNEALIASAVSRLSLIPYIGNQLQEPVKAFFKLQKERLHGNRSDSVDLQKNWISEAFDLLVFCMVLYFIVSIIHSFAQSYHKRLCTCTACKCNLLICNHIEGVTSRGGLLMLQQSERDKSESLKRAMTKKD